MDNVSLLRSISCYSLPSCRRYPVSSVLLSNPTSYHHLPFLLVIACRPYSLWRVVRISQVAVIVSLYNVPRPMTPGCYGNLAKAITIILPSASVHSIGQPIWDFEAQYLHHVLSARYLTCLRLNPLVTYRAPRLATGGWLILVRWESHPLYNATYAWTHEPSLRLHLKA